MKKNRLLSLGAIALTIACFTPVSASAAEYNKTPGQAKDAILEMAENAYKGGKVINGLDITVDTPVSDYATGNLTTEMDKLAADLGLEGFDYSKGLYVNFLTAKAQSTTLTTNDGKLETIKEYINGKLDGFKDANEKNKGYDYVKNYINVSQYGYIVSGINGEGKPSLALFDKKGQLLGILSNDEVEKAQNQLNKVKSWDQLRSFLGNNGILDVINEK